MSRTREFSDFASAVDGGTLGGAVVPAANTITAAMPQSNAVTTAKINDGALTADATGRAKMADNFVNAAKMLDGAVTTAKINDGALSADATGRAKMADGFLTAAKMGYVGAIIQIAQSTASAVNSDSGTIPLDDTAPQNTEGGEFLTCSITPTSASNALWIEFNGVFAGSAAVHLIAALFQDSTASALTAVVQKIPGANDIVTVRLLYRMLAGTTSATTFKIRAGLASAGTTTFNGSSSGNRLFGGQCVSTLRVIEMKA